METENLYQNKIFVTVPAGFTQLSERKLDLDRTTEADPSTMQELYRVLADEFEELGYSMLAQACRRSSDRWRLKISREV